MLVVALPVSEPVNPRDNQVVMIKVKVRRMEKFFGMVSVVPVQSSQIKFSPNREARRDKRVYHATRGKGPAGKTIKI